jgi:bifunctional NMN adenylyltransferase/nudix hydrolase
MQKPSYGVIVARCQVHKLHEGHLWLFNEVKSRHNRVILFLGVRPIGATYKNPLDFETRKAMVQAEFPDFNILPLPDTKTDEQWSSNLDNRIRELADYGDVTLYGSRDSFTAHYTGSYKPVELTMPHALRTINGTDIRAEITNNVLQSPDFRAGVIHAITNLRPQVKATVDIVITHTTLEPSKTGKREDGMGKLVQYFLLGQKPGENQRRFVGGFSEPTTPSYEFDAKREAQEETGLNISDLKYIGSALIPDWRWAGEPDQIKTLVFTGTSMTMGGRADDDIAKVKWVKAEELEESMFIDTHKPIWNIVKAHFNLTEGKATYAASNSL